jgi:hypothetical protein
MVRNILEYFSNISHIDPFFGFYRAISFAVNKRDAPQPPLISTMRKFVWHFHFYPLFWADSEDTFLQCNFSGEIRGSEPFGGYCADLGISARILCVCGSSLK